MNNEGVVFATSVAGQAATKSLVDGIPELDIRRHTITVAKFARHNCAISGVNGAGIKAPAGKHVGISNAMGAVVGIAGSNDGILIEVFCHHGKMFRDLHARDVGRDDAEFAADVGRCIGFRIEGIDVGRATLHPHEDNTEVIDGLFLLCSSSICLK